MLPSILLTMGFGGFALAQYRLPSDSNQTSALRLKYDRTPLIMTVIRILIEDPLRPRLQTLDISNITEDEGWRFAEVITIASPRGLQSPEITRCDTSAGGSALAVTPIASDRFHPLYNSTQVPASIPSNKPPRPSASAITFSSGAETNSIAPKLHQTLVFVIFVYKFIKL